MKNEAIHSNMEEKMKKEKIYQTKEKRYEKYD